MCGIAGTIDPVGQRAAARVSLLNDAQLHRGPDHSVVVRVGGFTVGNTRLAIQDPGSAGNQPFISADGRYHCVFNGEIYNHRRLVERYQLPVRTNCDGEVIPWLWAKRGVASIAELQGMFAIALVDSLEERLYLARDPFGIKPLYWRALPDGTLIFASEIRPLVRAAGGVRIDSAAIARYLHLGAMGPDQAPFQEISALPPNTVASFSRDGRVTLKPILADGPLSAIKSPADLGIALLESIDLHLSADVPTALLLSAGVDSATIAAVARRLGRDLHCLTVATHGVTDESVQAAETARHYGHRFQRVPAALEDSDLGKFFGAMQRPSIDGLNTYLISKAVHDAGFKVALSGLGGDEAVGGYSHFRMLRYLPAFRALQLMPDSVITPIAKILAQMGVASEAKATRFLCAGGPRSGSDLSLLQREVLPRPMAVDLTGIDHGPVLDGSSRDASCSFGSMVATEVAIYLESTLLPDADSFSMASSLELRVPFVNSSVFAASLNLNASKRRGPGKAAFGLALDDPYLRQLAHQPKRGFTVPMQNWMKGPLLSVLSATDDPDSALWSVIDRSIAESAGLIPLRTTGRWAEAWVFAALNAWLETMVSD